MRQGGTDMLAVACIVGGGVVAGGVTLALASGPTVPSLDCATYVGPEAKVVTRLGDEGVVVVRPDVRVREVRDCMASEAGEAQVAPIPTRSLAARGEVERVRREVEEARREADRVREEIDRVRDRVRRSAELSEEERRELIALELAEVAFQEQVAEAGRDAAERERMTRERARVEREIARRVRENARGSRERARAEREAARIERDAARLERELAAEARERAQEERQHAVQVRARASVDRARAVELRERVVSPALPSISRLRLRDAAGNDGATDEESAEVTELTGSLTQGLQIRLPDRSFRISFRGLEGLEELSTLEELGDDVDFAELEEALERQLEVLESLDFRFEGLDEDVAEQIEERIDEEMRALEVRLERVRGEIGG